ncbi:MAG: hypothetical protein AAFV93_03475, partial [Chloroflexota bacterium]
MQTLLRRLTDTIADSTSLLALATAILLIVLYPTTGSLWLLIACIPYTILGAIGIYTKQRDLRQVITSEPHIDENPTSIGAMADSMTVTVDGLVRATHAINDVTAQQSTSAQEQVEVIGNANTMLDQFLDLSERISEQVRYITQSSQTAADISETGQHALHQTLDSMRD